MSQSHLARTRTDLGLAACGCAAWLALAGCEGSATQTTTGKGIEGVLVDAHGNPVGGADVKVWPSAYGPSHAGRALDSAQAASARTDEHGHYAISDLEVGVYNVFGADPANHATVLIPRVKYLEQAADLGTDTLKAPGVVIGRVRVDGGNPPMAFCYLEGSNYAAISDDSGRFVLPDVAEGAYRLNYSANGYAAAIDSVVTVRSGDTTVLGDKTLALDLALQPPAPQGISATYDPVYGIVHLSWHPVRVSDFKDYRIEIEDTLDPAPMLEHSWTGTDTVFEDRTIIAYAGVYGNDNPFTRRYWVRARDAEGNLSPKPAQPVTVRITVPTIFDTEFTMRMVTDTAAQAGCLDTLAIALDVASSPDSLVRIQWQAKGYYHDSESANGQEGVAPNGSVRVSIGAPHRDTLYLTHQTLDRLGASGSQIGWDSVSVSVAVVGGNRGARLPIIKVDSLGCFHPSSSDR
jgi:hypothetical protein